MVRFRYHKEESGKDLNVKERNPENRSTQPFASRNLEQMKTVDSSADFLLPSSNESKTQNVTDSVNDEDPQNVNAKNVSQHASSSSEVSESEVDDDPMPFQRGMTTFDIPSDTVMRNWIASHPRSSAHAMSTAFPGSGLGIGGTFGNLPRTARDRL
jgi:hypothetical protein